MDYSEDHIALAAEYALGTLNADERDQVETMMSADRDFTTMVRAWEYRLGVLNQMVGSVEPPAEVWERIRGAIGLTEPQAEIVLPEPPPAAPPPIQESEPPAPVVIDPSNVIRLAVRAQRWRGVASAMSAVAAVLVAMIGIQIFQPDWLPPSLRPKPRTEIVEVKPSPTPAPPSAQYVALLQRDGGSPAFILTVDAATKNFTVRKVGTDAAEAGKSFELWLISDRLPQPRSLGVIGTGDFTARPALSSYDANTINAATYAITVEQAGGSPDGKPHSTPIYTGKLIETVPAAR